MRLAVPTALVLVAGALIPEPPRAFQVLVAIAMLGALGVAGDRLARWLCPGFGRLSRGVAAFTFALALAVAPATWMGHFGVMRPAPFLIWTAVALLLSLLVPARSESGKSSGAILTEADRWTRAEWALVLAAGATLALLGLKYAFHYWLTPVGLGPDDESYHLAAMAVWHRFGDLRMIKFAVGDTSTTFYPVGGEVWSWVLLAPFRDSDVLSRWAQLPFAVASFAATAAIARRLGLPLRPALMAALLFAAIRRSYPVLAYTAGNDHSTSFFTLAAIDGVLALAAAPAAGLAVYAGVALGLLLGTKYIGLLFAPVVLAMLALAGLGHRPPWRRLAGFAALIGVASVAAGGYTYLRNWVTAGNPIFPAPLSFLGHSIFPGWEAAGLGSRQLSPESRIDVWKFLLDRRDLLGSFFPYTMLPAALAAPLVALGRRRGPRGQWWRDFLVLLLPAAFFLEFLYLMADHRDMRYFLPAVALAAVAFAWLVEQAGPRASWLRLLVLLVLAFHIARKLDLDGALETGVALVLIALGWLAVGLAPRLTALAEAPRRWLPLGAAAAAILAALPLGAAVRTYQAEKLFQRPAALALERLAGPGGSVVAYVGLNKPYTFFGSRLQNDVRIVPRQGDLEDQYYEWGGTPDFPYAGDDYVRWRRRLEALDVDFVVVHRSPWEDPEREWMTERPGSFTLERADPTTEIWRVVSAEDLWRRRHHRDSGEAPSAPGPEGEDTAPTPGSKSGSSSSAR